MQQFGISSRVRDAGLHQHKLLRWALICFAARSDLWAFERCKLHAWTRTTGLQGRINCKARDLPPIAHMNLDESDLAASNPRETSVSSCLLALEA